MTGENTDTGSGSSQSHHMIQLAVWNESIDHDHLVDVKTGDSHGNNTVLALPVVLHDALRLKHDVRYRESCRGRRRASKHRVDPGRLVHDVGHLIEILPTCVGLAGVEYPTEWNDRPVPPMPGMSLTR